MKRLCCLSMHSLSCADCQVAEFVLFKLGLEDLAKVARDLESLVRERMPSYWQCDLDQSRRSGCNSPKGGTRE
jgi:hypothetical protein